MGNCVNRFDSGCVDNLGPQRSASSSIPSAPSLLAAIKSPGATVTSSPAVRERLLKLMMKSKRVKASCGCHGRLFTLDKQKTCSVG